MCHQKRSEIVCGKNHFKLLVCHLFLDGWKQSIASMFYLPFIDFNFIQIYFSYFTNSYVWSLHIISLLFMRISNFFSCSLNNVTKDRTDDIILTSRCWTTTSVFSVLWTTFCRAVFPFFSSAHAIMTRAFLFASSSVIWIPLPIMKLYLYFIDIDMILLFPFVSSWCYQLLCENGLNQGEIEQL